MLIPYYMTPYLFLLTSPRGYDLLMTFGFSAMYLAAAIIVNVKYGET